MDTMFLFLILIVPSLTAKMSWFDNLQWGTRMTNTDFKVYTNLSIENFYYKCKNHSQCRSFNYWRKMGQCWLNKMSKMESLENMEKKPGFIFSDREGWSQDNSGKKPQDGEDVSVSVKECEAPTSIDNSVLLGNQNYIGSKAKRLCYRRGKLVASTTVTCLRNGSWSKDKFTCPASCPENYIWYEKGSFCYLIGDTCEGWDTARAICQRQGGDLLAIPDDHNLQVFQENARLILESCYDGLWLGATDEAQEGMWMWVTGEKMNSTLWKPNKPDNKNNNEHCLVIQKYTWFSMELLRTISSNRFDDFSCRRKNKYACQLIL